MRYTEKELMLFYAKNLQRGCDFQNTKGYINIMEENRNNLQPEEQEESGENRSPKEEGRRSKKGAIILISVILGMLVVVSALAAVDFDALGGTIFDEREEVYYDPIYGEDIWSNEEYMQHAFYDMRISVDEGEGYVSEYSFGDADSAAEAFLAVANRPNGAKALSDYFYALLNGADTSGEKMRFRALFSENYRINRGKSELPGGFTRQKVYDLKFEYLGQDVSFDGESTCYCWLVDYRVVRNDGTVLNYSSGVDGGQARFFVEPTADGGFLIKEIIGIYRVN